MSRRLVLLAVVAGIAGFGPSSARAATECDGLIVCIPVKGPWVQVPGGGTPTYYQLSCPGRGQVIGGLDADRAGPLELSFLGALGGPVGPGVTTGRSAVFVARTSRSLASFRPLLGCIPAGGGGGRARTSYEPKSAFRTEALSRRNALGGALRRPQSRRYDPYRRLPASLHRTTQHAPPTRPQSETRSKRKLMAAAPVVEATIRRVKNVRLKDVQSERAAQSCLAGERLIAHSTAIAFRRNPPLSLSALGSVRASGRRSGNRVVVNVRSGITRPQGVRVELQIHAVCVRGPS